ncbi:thiamine diphosphokinase [Anaeromicropila populeti]|uniref:Thiamine diphosphokinase n=1 Tax=Anaeromicropila populeti TaxID=37658 RepID=A0A1I6KWP2_9FIRM|nr:thiamine diphosphokinase [Anaeromicropila populeti]SFR95652.1 thiamine pyrophosphokinase [Anaeromicropila populeti]
MYNCFLILTGGRIDELFLREYLDTHDRQTIICVDGGLEPAYRVGIIPEFVVGDFDTVSKDVLTYYKKISGVEIYEYNPEKDATDTEIALELAISKGAVHITIMGATGTRFDHMLGSMANLKKVLLAGIQAEILDEYNKIYLINQPVTIHKMRQYGKYVSLLPFTEKVTGITLTGMKYPLTNHTLSAGDSLGISNEIISEQAEILLDSGILIVVEAKDN